MEEVWEVSSKENAKIFSFTNGVHMEGAWEVCLEENARILKVWRKVVHQQVLEVKKICKGSNHVIRSHMCAFRPLLYS